LDECRRLTLEALGLGGFGYDLHALEGGAAGPYENYTVRRRWYKQRIGERAY